MKTLALSLLSSSAAAGFHGIRASSKPVLFPASRSQRNFPPRAELGSTAYETLKQASVVSAYDGRPVYALNTKRSKRLLVVVLPQLGEFDSAEMCEQLAAIKEDMEKADIALRVIGIGDKQAAKRFCEFTGLDSGKLVVSPDAAVHRALNLHSGPNWRVPGFVPNFILESLLSSLPGGKPADRELLRPWFDGWLNYLAMCAGIAAPGTLPEILRGYIGDMNSPERLRPDAMVKAGPIEIGPGVGPVKLGPLSYSINLSGNKGYLRPVELATVRLRNMVEVLTNWDGYVSDPTLIPYRGATFLFDNSGKTLYEYRHRGVLTYSQTMATPLSFLAPYIGERSLNALELGDDKTSASYEREKKKAAQLMSQPRRR